MTMFSLSSDTQNLPTDKTPMRGGLTAGEDDSSLGSILADLKALLHATALSRKTKRDRLTTQAGQAAEEFANL
jgi:hypothetical protein